MLDVFRHFLFSYDVRGCEAARIDRRSGSISIITFPFFLFCGAYQKTQVDLLD